MTQASVAKLSLPAKSPMPTSALKAAFYAATVASWRADRAAAEETHLDPPLPVAIVDGCPKDGVGDPLIWINDVNFSSRQLKLTYGETTVCAFC